MCSFSKAGPRKITQHYHRHSTSILTDTPVKQRLVNIPEEKKIVNENESSQKWKGGPIN